MVNEEPKSVKRLRESRDCRDGRFSVTGVLGKKGEPPSGSDRGRYCDVAPGQARVVTICDWWGVGRGLKQEINSSNLCAIRLENYRDDRE